MTRQADLTHAEARAAFRAFAANIGSKAAVYISLNAENHARVDDLCAAIYPEGLLGKGRVEAAGSTYRELLLDCAVVWAERSDLHATNTIREMALKIISITADQGECTDAALRATFDAADVARYGERSCAQATEMASNGPFSIVKLSGANQNEAA